MENGKIITLFPVALFRLSGGTKHRYVGKTLSTRHKGRNGVGERFITCLKNADSWDF